MKKYIPVLIITSLLLSSCSMFGISKEDLFEKKQECQKYTESMLSKAKDRISEDAQIDEIFYSPSKKSCFFIADGGIELNNRKYIYDYLSQKIVDEYSTIKNCDSDICIKTETENYTKFQNLIKELKGE